MGKKKKFGFSDVVELAGHAATLAGYYKDAQAAAKKSFADGNKTNLKGAEGGKSPKTPKSNTGRGSSQLALDEIDKYRKY